jgi:hypothetical protein
LKQCLLERRRYCERPPREEYLLTELGRDFRPVLLALIAWGNKHYAPEGASVLLADAVTGEVVEPVMVDSATGRKLTEIDFRLVAGPAAGEQIRKRLAVAEENRKTNLSRSKEVTEVD